MGCTFNNCSFNLEVGMVDCLEAFLILEAEVAGGDLTDNEAYPGARLKFLEDCLGESFGFNECPDDEDYRLDIKTNES